MTGNLNETQQATLAIAPKLSSGLSMLGSGFIVKEVLIDAKKRSSVFYRLLLGVSSIDLILSFFYFLSTWPVPKGTKGVYGAVGTQTTCTIQGFFFQLGSMAFLYNTSMALYHLFLVKYSFKAKELKIFEKAVHFASISFGLGTAVAGIPLTLYNYSNLWCWIASFPEGCDDTSRMGEINNCIRGHNAQIFRLAFWYGPLFLCFPVVIGSMISIYLAVRKVETKEYTYRFASQRRGSRKKSKQVGRRGMLYIAAFVGSWIPSIATRVMQLFMSDDSCNAFFPPAVMMVILEPMQGFFNFFIYFGPKYIQLSRAHRGCCPRMKAFCDILCNCDKTKIIHSDNDEDDESVADIDELN